MTISRQRCEVLAREQGLKLHKSRYRSVMRWILTRGDGADYKDERKVYLVYRTLGEVRAALQIPGER